MAATQVKRKKYQRRRRSTRARRPGQRLEQRKWISKDELAERFGVSSQTIENWIHAGKLPAPIYFSRQVVRFSVATIEEFEADAASSRPGGRPRLPQERINEQIDSE